MEIIRRRNRYGRRRRRWRRRDVGVVEENEREEDGRRRGENSTIILSRSQPVTHVASSASPVQHFCLSAAVSLFLSSLHLALYRHSHCIFLTLVSCISGMYSYSSMTRSLIFI